MPREQSVRAARAFARGRSLGRARRTARPRFARLARQRRQLRAARAAACRAARSSRSISRATASAIRARPIPRTTSGKTSAICSTLPTRSAGSAARCSAIRAAPAISMLFAATFPERVDKLILLEGGVPLTAEADEAPAGLAQALRETRALRGKAGRVFADAATAIAERAAGFSKVTPAAAEVLARRSLREVPGGFQWHADQRLKAQSELRLTAEHVRAFARTRHGARAAAVRRARARSPTGRCTARCRALRRHRGRPRGGRPSLPSRGQRGRDRRAHPPLPRAARCSLPNCSRRRGAARVGARKRSAPMKIFLVSQRLHGIRRAQARRARSPDARARGRCSCACAPRR